jgi:hypothetical protein
VLEIKIAAPVAFLSPRAELSGSLPPPSTAFVSVHAVDLGRALHVWVGEPLPAEARARRPQPYPLLVSAVPFADAAAVSAFALPSAAAPAATQDAAGVCLAAEESAARLARRLGRLVLMSTAMTDAHPLVDVALGEAERAVIRHLTAAAAAAR